MIETLKEFRVDLPLQLSGLVRLASAARIEVKGKRGSRVSCELRPQSKFAQDRQELVHVWNSHSSPVLFGGAKAGTEYFVEC